MPAVGHGLKYTLFYKNLFYKNVEAEIWPKILKKCMGWNKNIPRLSQILQRSYKK